MDNSKTVFGGFTGETCGSCGLTANVDAYCARWTCTCGHENVLPSSDATTPHDEPDLGPRREVLEAAHVHSEEFWAKFSEGSLAFNEQGELVERKSKTEDDNGQR